MDVTSPESNWWGKNRCDIKTPREDLAKTEPLVITNRIWPDYFVFVFAFQGLQHMEVPRLGFLSELQLPAYATATSTQDPSWVCDLHHSSRQRRILNPLSEARDRTPNLMYTSWIWFCCAAIGTPDHQIFKNRNYWILRNKRYILNCDKNWNYETIWSFYPLVPNPWLGFLFQLSNASCWPSLFWERNLQQPTNLY